jgi:hypothetical protein
MEEIHEQWKRAIEVADMGIARLGYEIRLSLRAASARYGYALHLYRSLDRQSSVDELNHVIDVVRRGAPASVLGAGQERLKSRLFEIGMRAASRHPSQGPRNEILALWARELPNDPWLIHWTVLKT